MKDIQSNKGATYVAEAIIGLIIIGSIVVLITNGLLIQSAILDPEQQERDAQLQNELDEILNSAKEDGSLKAFTLSWDLQNGQWSDPQTQNVGSEYRTLPEDPFGERLQHFVTQNDVRMNVFIYGTDAQIGINQTGIVGANEKSDPINVYTEGEPGDQSVSTRQQIVLYESDRLLSSPETHRVNAQSPNIEDGSEDRLRDIDGSGETYPVERSSPSSNVYNTVSIEVVVWDI